MRLLLALFALAGCAAPSKAPPRLVDVREAAPGIRLDIRYATTNNFTGTVLYGRAACYLAPKAAARLAAVQRALEPEGLGLKVFDCYRPLSVQRRLWRLVPDPRYVADPKKGSRHNRAHAVDLTLVEADGMELEMPTGYDDFTEAAHRGAPASEAAARHRAMLAAAMEAQGFIGLRTEWWHFDAPGWRDAPLLDVPLEDLP